MAGKDFIQFILDAQHEENLVVDFIKAETPGQLNEFFETNGYHEIDASDRERIWDAKQSYNITEWPPPPAY